MSLQVKDPAFVTAVAQVTAEAQVQYLAWELLHTMNTAKKEKKKKIRKHLLNEYKKKKKSWAK